MRGPGGEHFDRTILAGILLVIACAVAYWLR